MADRDEAISNFCELTSASDEQATEYLSAAAWDLESAVTAFFADRDETAAGFSTPGAEASAAPAEPEYTGPRTLDGRPAPQYASSSSKAASKKPQKRRGIATLGSLNNDDDDEDDDDSDDGGRGDLFAGGEKSGLAVQDPNQRSNDPKKLINDIIAKAKANSGRSGSSEPGPPTPPGPSGSRFFRGAGQTVGGDGAESRTIPDPAGNPIPSSRGAEGPPQERVLHLWADGFSIDDGELRRFDDPQNAMDLQMIRQGRAPLHLMNVRYDQPVDVKLQQHAENYRALPKVYRPFSGEGRRLGSPVPGDGNAAPTPSATTTTSAAASGSQTRSMTVDESQPTLLLRIQMPDGTRLPARFNTTHTVNDVYEFVQRATAATQSRPWVLATTFPNKDHTDKSLVLGDVPEFKKGGTAVVKWV